MRKLKQQPEWVEARPQLDLVDMLHAMANGLSWPGRLIRRHGSSKARLTFEQLAELRQELERDRQP